MSGALLSIAVLQVLTILVGLLRAKGLALLLGPSDFGVVSTIDQVVVTLVTLGALALPFTALKFLARGHSEGEAPFRRITASFVRVLAVLALSMTILASTALAMNPGIFGADLAKYGMELHLALLGIPAAMLHLLFVNALAAAERPAPAAGLNLAMVLGLGVAVVAGAALSGLRGLYVANAFVGAIALVLSVAYLRRSIGLNFTGFGLHIAAELRRNREIFSSAAYLYVAMSTYGLSLLAIRYVVLSRLGEVPAGLLQVSLSIALTVGAVLNTMSNLHLMPLVNRQIPIAEKVRAADDFALKVLGLLLLGSLPVVLFPRFLVIVLYSPAFAAAAGTVFLFVLWQCVYQIANVYQQLLVGLDDVLFMSAAATAGYGSAAVLAWVLVPNIGLSGAAIALGSGMALYGVLAIVRLRLHHAITVASAVLGRAAGVIFTVALAGHLFGGGVGELTLRGMAIRVAFCVATLTTYWFFLGVAERTAVTGLLGILRWPRGSEGPPGPFPG